MASISGFNHWWQNWSKTHGYIAEQMFFPRSADDIADAIKQAEAQQRPIRAVGGGWSFSDASLPGSVTTNRPDVHGLEAIAKVVPRTVTFPPPSAIPSPSIASIPAGSRAPDVAGSMIMVAEAATLETNIGLWAYSGGGTWTYGSGWSYPATDPASLTYFAQKGVRPIRNPGSAFQEDSDVAGSLVMFNMSLPTPAPSRDWFYNGQGSWSVGVAGDSPFDQGDLATLVRNGRIGGGAGVLSPRAAGPGEVLSLVLSRNGNVPKLPEPVFLIDTRLLASSLQDRLPDILAPAALAASARTQPVGARKFYAHFEAGITIDQIGRLLAHQSPPLSLLAISGSPGATLAGAITTATHGAEFNWTLLIDTVKALHLVGPGGVHWWIEGDVPIADPQKLRAVYPEIKPEHIISGTTPVGGITPQDWLNAAIVSMGSMGVLYSVVLEVVRQFGVHEAVVETTWSRIGTALANVPMPDPTFQAFAFSLKLRMAPTSRAASSAVLTFLLDGAMNGTGIGRDVNQYADLAINPIRRPDGDFDCWIGNRETTLRLPIDPQPPPSGETAEMLNGITRAFRDATTFQKLRNINRLGNVWDMVWNASSTGTQLSRITAASDLIDVGLDAFLSPMIGSADGRDVARALLTGILGGLLGTANPRARSDKTGVTVGALGFPASGVMGTALEIAIAPADAFTFLETEILDHMDAASPFFGYISIRICSQTRTLMGMQQFGDTTNPYSVMIEIVAFATPNCRQFMRDLQDRTVARINAGLDAMLHWGLENDRVTGQHLRNTLALRRPASPGIGRLDTWKAVRGLVRAAGQATFNAFNNAFTTRMWLNAAVDDDDPWSFQTVQLGTRKATKVGARNVGNAPRRIIGVSADGDFRMRALPGSPGLPPNLEVGPIPAAPVAAGSIFELPLALTPTEARLHNGTLTIVTHADVPDSIRVIRIRLHANVDAMAVSMVDPAPPAPLDFGPVDVGSTKTVGIVVRCDGTLNASLDRYTAPDPAAWAQLGVATFAVGSVPAGQTKTYWVSFTPAVSGPFSITLTLHFVGGSAFSPHAQDVSLAVTGTGVGAQAVLSPSSLAFGTVTVGARSAIQRISIRNAGQIPLTIASALTGSGFAVAGPLPATVAPGQEEEADLQFRALADGPVSNTFSIQSNSAQPPVPIALSGIGALGAYLTAKPAMASFGTVPVGSQSPEREIEISNDGLVPVTLQGFALGGPDAAAFRIVRNDRAVGDVLGPEQRCRIVVVFADPKSGPKAATLEIAHDLPNTPFRVPVDGRSVEPKGLVPTVTELDFGEVAVGTSKQRRFTLTNAAGRSMATIASITVAGKDLADFAIVKDDCSGNRLDPGDTCTLTVAAAPVSMGALEAELKIETNVPADPIPLRAVGMDVRVDWSPPSLDFATWKVAQTSQRQTVAIRNAGNAPVVVTQIVAAGEFMVVDTVPQFPSVPPNGEKYLWVWFRPTVAGPAQGSITVQTASHGTLPPLPLAGIAVP